MVNEWKLTNDYYNRDVVKCNVYSKKVSKSRVIYLQDSESNNFMYTFSCGANSDYSFTGCFYNTSVDSLAKAMDYLDQYAPLHFADKLKELKNLRNSINVSLKK